MVSLTLNIAKFKIFCNNTALSGKWKAWLNKKTEI